MFTPMNSEGTERLRFEDHEVTWLTGALRRGPGLYGTVEIAGQRYEVHGRDCGSPSCYCDATLIPIVKPASFYDRTHPLSATYHGLYEKLVPDSGKCETLEGELLRAVSRIGHDYTNNGFGNNWSGALKFLDEHFDIPRKVYAALRPYARGKICQKYHYDENDPILAAVDKLTALVTVEVVSRNGKYQPNPCDMFDLQERAA